MSAPAWNIAKKRLFLRTQITKSFADMKKTLILTAAALYNPQIQMFDGF
jgi:hypothetical protein